MSPGFSALTGTVGDLEIFDGEQEFLSSGQRQLGTAVAVGLAVGGLAGAAMGASGATLASGDSVQFFRCRVGDAWVEGAFSKVTFKAGDLVTAVGEGSKDALDAKAVYRASDNMLWMAPHCSRGTSAHLRFSMAMAYKIALVVIIICIPLLWPHSWHDEHWVEKLEFFGAIDLVIAVTAALYYSIRFHRQWKGVARLAEDVFRALGYANPQAVDLPRENVKCSRRLGIKWPYLTDGPWIYRCLIPAK